MKIFYTKIACLVIILLANSNFASAQRVAVLEINYISANVTSGTDCDQVCALTADNQIDWYFDLDDNGTNIDGECWNAGQNDNNDIEYTGNYSVYEVSESAQCDWPSGNVGWSIQAFDGDCTDGCVLGEFINVFSDLACTVNISSAIPSSTGGTTAWTTNSCNFSNVDFDGGWNCYGNVNVNWRWRVYGGFSYYTPGNNSICSAYTLGGTTLTAGESVNNTNATNICANRQGGEPFSDILQTIWYKFTTPPEGLLQVDVHLGENGAGADNPAIAVYRYSGTPGCSFGSLVLVDEDTPALGTDSNSDIELNCLWGNTTYFIQVGHDDRFADAGSPGRFDLDVSAAGYATGPDNFCAAGELVTSGNGLLDRGESFARNNQSNECASDETNEPETNGNDETVWYKFTTGSIVGNNVDVHINRDERIDPYVAVYVACNGTAACNSTNLNNYGLNQIADAGTSNPINVPINDNPTASFVPYPNTTYYVQVDGYDCCNVVGGPTGRFDVSISMSSTNAYAYDNLCGAYNLGTLGLGSTINSPTLNTFNSSSEELCGLNEPNNDEDDETTWLKFTTGSTPGTEIEIDASANNDGSGGLDCLFGVSFAWIRVYEEDGSPTLVCPFPNTSTNHFNAISEADSDGGFLNASKRFLICPKPNTTYYIQVENQALGCDVSSFSVQINDNGAYGYNDDLCEAYHLGTLTNQGTLQSGSGGIPSAFSTDCATKQFGEPNVDVGESNDQEGSVWFSFTTAASGVGVKTDVDVSWVSGHGIAVAENEFLRTHLYYDPGNCNTLNDLIDFDNKEDESYYTNDALVDGCIDNGVLGDLDKSTRTFGCLAPNTTYYLQVFVKSFPDIGIFDEKGVFDLIIDNSRPIAADNDDFVDATLIPTIASSSSPSNRSYPAASQLLNENNLCAGVESFDAGIASDIDDINHTVWYRFLAPASGSVQFEVVNTSASNDPEEDIEEQIWVFDYSGGVVPTSSTQFLNLMEYDADDDGPFGEDGEITWSDKVFVTCLDPGEIYYVRIDGAYDGLTGYCPGDAMRGDFDLRVRDYDIWETNDQICSATDLTSFSDNPTLTTAELNTWQSCGNEVTIELNYQSNYCANNINEIINPWNDAPSHTVWYAFEAPGTGMVTFDVENYYSCNVLRPDQAELIDIRLAVYDLVNDNCVDMVSNASGVQLKGESESGITGINCIGLSESLEIDCLEPGRTYYLVVDGKTRTGNTQGEYGEFEIDMTNTVKNLIGNNIRDLFRPALNDDICDAIALGDPTGGGVDTDDANGTYPSPSRGSCNNSENTYCADNSGDPAINGFSLWGTDNSVWYTFVAPVSGAVEINVDGSVHGNSDQLSPQIAVFETSNQVTPCAGTLFDVFVGPAISSGFSTNYNSGTINCLEPGNIYFLMVDGGPYAGDLFDIDGTFEVTITEETPTETPPVNDDICDAISINPFTSFGGGAPVDLNDQTNRCASREFQIPEPSTFTRDRTVWYTFMTPSNPAGSNGNGTYAVDVRVLSDLPWPFGDAMDPQISIYESSNNLCGGTITEKYSDFDVLNVPFTESLNVQCLEPATRYWIMVDGSTFNVQGYFGIDVDEDLSPTPIATNDAICSNTNLGTLGGSNGNTLGGTTPLYNNFCAGIEPGEPNPQWLLVNNIDHTVWFQFTTPNVAQNVNVDIELYSDNSDNVDLMMALYLSSDNTCSGTMTEIKKEYDPTILFCLDGLCDERLNDMCLAPNTTYFLQVDGSFLNRQGYFGVEVINDGLVNGPANDDFCNATAMTFNGSGIARLNNQDNECATVELNEPFTNHPIVVSAKRTVWYSFVAPTSGRVTITTEDDDGAVLGIDPHWALYDFNGACVSGGITGGFSQLENAYFPTVALTNPDDNDEYLCLFPGDTYYIQVDGSFLGKEGRFNIEIEDMYPNYTSSPEPSNNDCSLASTALTVQEKSCQFDDGGWFTFDYGEATRSFRDEEPGCGNNCGDTWYTFDMPALDPGCPGNVSFVKIEGRDATGTLGLDQSDLSIVAWSGTNCNSLTYMDCSVSSQEDINSGFLSNDEEADFSIAAAPGTQIWLQVYSNKGNDYDNEDFDICVSRRYSADDCLDALADTMDYNVEYCWDIRDATGEDIVGGDLGYTLQGNVGVNTDNSAYFQFLTDDYCWGYEVIVRITDTDGLSEGGDCGDGIFNFGASGVMQMAIFEDATPCDGTYDARLDYQEIHDCETEYLTTVEWRQTYYVDRVAPVDGDSIAPDSRFVIQLESENRDIMDGTIEIRKICDGRDWDYVSTIGTTVSDGYCYDPESGYRHYYEDAGTPADPSDDILMFSLHPGGNLFEGTASVTLLPSYSEATTPGIEGSWTMKRYWDFDLTPSSGSINPALPVSVRFYYLDDEKNEIINEANAFATLHGLQYEPFEWFKSDNGVDFDPSIHVTPPVVIAGWSETGQFTDDVFAVNGGDYAQDHDEDPTNEWCNGVQYVEITGLTGFSGGTGATGASDNVQSPLPIELISFVGWNDGEVNQLEWITASEINNEVFVVERSADALNFVEIGTVPGSGNTTVETTYNLTDYTPIQGVNYYRLKQIDFDGSSEYSSIIAVEVRNGVAKTAIVKLHPNPANDLINIQLQSASTTSFEMRVVDITGRIVEVIDIEAVEGLNPPLALEIQDYPQGVYLIILVDKNTGESMEAKFIKQ